MQELDRVEREDVCGLTRWSLVAWRFCLGKMSRKEKEVMAMVKGAERIVSDGELC
jgi:hypothetical protein